MQMSNTIKLFYKNVPQMTYITNSIFLATDNYSITIRTNANKCKLLYIGIWRRH